MNSINGTTKICFVLGSHCIAHTDLELEVLLSLPPKAALQVCSSTATKDSLAEGPGTCTLSSCTPRGPQASQH